jgi:4-hydroxy-3-methylbut-2-enyl diphosphate reductase
MIETLYLAKPRGFCAGVVRAIEAVEEVSQEKREAEEGELVVYHAIVHNDTVVERLEQTHGAHFVERMEDIKALKRQAEAEGRKLADTVVFSAHGVSPVIRQEAARLGLATVDATCPLVTKVHSEAKKYVSEGYHILLISDSSTHQEVIGTRGEAPEQTTIVSVAGNRKHDPELADPETVTVPNPDKVVVLTQTTISVDDTRKTVEVLKQRFPKLLVPPAEDLCYATKNRQDAVRHIAPRAQLFLVVTSDYSSNGTRLLELAQELCGNARRLEGVSDIQEEWLENVTSVGVTSAASTPDDLVREISAFFKQRNPRLRIVEEGEWENITFRKPKHTSAEPKGA